MKYYALQTTLTVQQIHEKLEFKAFEELNSSEFDENEDQIYSMSIYRIEDKSPCDFTNAEIMRELLTRGIGTDEFGEFIDIAHLDADGDEALR